MSNSIAYAATSPARARLLGRPAGLLGAASAVVALGSVVTGSLADGALEHGDLATRDPGVTAWLVQSRTPALSAVAQVVTTIGSEATIGVLTALVLAWLVLARRAWTEAVVVAVTMGTGAALTLALKHLVARHRPPAAVVLGPVDSGYSFPSGHTLFSTVFFGIVAALLLARTAHRIARVAVVLGWVMASGAVGASRLYLGYHWFTDVLASWTVAVAVLTCGYALWTLLRDRALPVPPGWRRGAGRLDDRSSIEAGS